MQPRPPPLLKEEKQSHPEAQKKALVESWLQDFLPDFDKIEDNKGIELCNLGLEIDFSKIRAKGFEVAEVINMPNAKGETALGKLLSLSANSVRQGWYKLHVLSRFLDHGVSLSLPFVSYESGELSQETPLTYLARADLNSDYNSDFFITFYSLLITGLARQRKLPIEAVAQSIAIKPHKGSTRSLLSYAIEGGNEVILRFLIEGCQAKVDQAWLDLDNTPIHPLYYAASHGQWLIASELLRYQPKLKGWMDPLSRQTIFHHLAFAPEKRIVSFFRHLKSNRISETMINALIHQPDDQGQTALDYAKKEGSADLFKSRGELLREDKAENLSTASAGTLYDPYKAFFQACEKGLSTQVYQFIISGFDIRSRDSEGETGFDKYLNFLRVKPALSILEREILRLFVMHTVDVSNTLLIDFCEGTLPPNVEVINALAYIAACRGTINYLDRQGLTVFDCAFARNYSEICRVLQNYGAVAHLTRQKSREQVLQLLNIPTPHSLSLQNLQFIKETKAPHPVAYPHFSTTAGYCYFELKVNEAHSNGIVELKLYVNRYIHKISLVSDSDWLNSCFALVKTKEGSTFLWQPQTLRELNAIYKTLDNPNCHEMILGGNASHAWETQSYHDIYSHNSSEVIHKYYRKIHENINAKLQQILSLLKQGQAPWWNELVIVELGCGGAEALKKVNQTLSANTALKIRAYGFDFSEYSLQTIKPALSNEQYAEMNSLRADFRLRQLMEINMASSLRVCISSGHFTADVLDNVHECRRVLQMLHRSEFHYILASGLTQPLYSSSLLEQIGFQFFYLPGENQHDRSSESYFDERVEVLKPVLFAKNYKPVADFLYPPVPGKVRQNLGKMKY